MPALRRLVVVCRGVLGAPRLGRASRFGLVGNWLVAAPAALAVASAIAQPIADSEDAQQTEKTSAPAEKTDPAALVMEGRFAEAFPLLERQVMLNADDVAAWIDYAHVVDALGRHDEARAIREFIAQELKVDEDTRKRLAALGPRVAPLIPAHQWRGEINLLTGHESNANAGPSVREVTFSLPGEAPFTWSLSDQSLPKSSASHLIEARLESTHALGNGVGLSTHVDWRQRNTPDAPGAGSRQWQADATLSFGASTTADSARQWLLSASALDYDYGSTTLFRRQRLSLGLDQRFGLQSLTPCRLQSTLEHEWRQHPAQNGLVSRLEAIQTAAVCAQGKHRWMALARVGVDRPQDERPGGDQLRRDFSIGYRFDLERWGQVEVQAAYSASRDSEVYNELFGMTRRRISRTQLYLNYMSEPFYGNWQAIARAEIFRQRANISLFQMRGNSVHLGLRYSF